MKKLISLFVLLSVITLSCNKDPEPEPEVIRSFVLLYHFVSGLESISWTVDGTELPDALACSVDLRGAVIGNTFPVQ
jgi:hypothetical protein